MAERDDGSWQDLSYWERIRWARARKFETVVSAAESMGMQPGTYAAYERDPASSKHTKLSHQAAAKFARKFGVRWQWLLNGEGKPWLTPDGDEEGPQFRVITAMSALPRERQEAVAAAIEALIKTGTGQ